jgi:mRNA interferase MazF
VNRGEIWLVQFGRKRRLALVLTRPQVIDVRALVTVAEVTTSIRRLAAEVSILEHDHAGLDRQSVINCDGIHTVARTSLITRVGSVSDATMEKVCSAIGYALGC